MPLKQNATWAIKRYILPGDFFVKWKGNFVRVGGVNMKKENVKKEWGSEKGGVKERV